MRRTRRTRSAVRAALILAALWIAGAGAAAGQQPGLPPCDSDEHRQFDFWLGEWEVRTEDGQFAGTNRITKDFGDCALREEWTGSDGGRGESFNLFDAMGGHWHQTWVDDRGRVLLLDGGLDSRGRMVLSGERPAPEGGTVIHEIAWEPREDGSVVQVWSVSSDAGATWRQVFRGIYTKNP